MKELFTKESHRALLEMIEDASADGKTPIAMVIVVVDSKGIAHGCCGYNRNDEDLEKGLKDTLHHFAESISDGEPMNVEDQ